MFVGDEERYKVSKRLFLIEDFHAKIERGVKQELFAQFVLITLNRLFANWADRDLNPHALSCEPLAPPGSSTAGAGTVAMRTLKTNFTHCLHVCARSLEDLLWLHGRIQTVVQRTVDSIVSHDQRVRPGRSYPRISMKPESKWHPPKKNRQPKNPTASMASI